MRTGNSGARFDDNDFIDESRSIECKRKPSQLSLSLSKEEIVKCQRKARKRNKEACWIVENSISTFVVVEYNDYANLLYELEEARRDQEKGKEEDS